MPLQQPDPPPGGRPRPADPSISIALATCNGERHLPEQLESLERQTLRPCELVVFDDASTDRTLAIVADFERTAPFPVRVFKNPVRLGYRSNFMGAARACTGNLVSFCDQDDIWAPTKLALMQGAFGDPETLLAFHNARLIDERGRRMGLIFKRARGPVAYEPLTFRPWAIVPGFTQVIRRSLLDLSDLHSRSVDMYCASDRMPHDQWFLFLASVLGRIARVPHALALYRQHDANTSGWLPARPVAYVLHSASHARYYAQATLAAIDNRIELLTELRDRPAQTNAERLERALAHYRNIQEHVRRRSNLYAARSLRSRTAALLSLAGSGAYTHRVPHFGLGNLLLDVCIGLPFGPVLTTREPP